MSSIPDELRDDSLVAKLLEWAQARPSIRAMLLTSTRACPNTVVDALSDYDVILVVPDIQPYHQDRSWLADFGDVLATYWDPIHKSRETDEEIFANVVQYESGLRIDFTLWPIEQARKVAELEYLPASLDVGYVVFSIKISSPTVCGHQRTQPTSRSLRPKQNSIRSWRSSIAMSPMSPSAYCVMS